MDKSSIITNELAIRIANLEIEKATIKAELQESQNNYAGLSKEYHEKIAELNTANARIEELEGELGVVEDEEFPSDHDYESD